MHKETTERLSKKAKKPMDNKTETQTVLTIEIKDGLSAATGGYSMPDAERSAIKAYYATGPKSHYARRGVAPWDPNAGKLSIRTGVSTGAPIDWMYNVKQGNQEDSGSVDAHGNVYPNYYDNRPIAKP
jgi:hypothetical protein